MIDLKVRNLIFAFFPS